MEERSIFIAENDIATTGLARISENVIILKNHAVELKAQHVEIIGGISSRGRVIQKQHVIQI